jgi:predicted RNA binding protein YcfA (HicA-like mRNA interferase family)
VKVKEIIELLERNGWNQVRTRGSHRQFRHPVKPGTVTVAGAMSKDLPLGTLKQIYRQAGLQRRQK